MMPTRIGCTVVVAAILLLGLQTSSWSQTATAATASADRVKAIAPFLEAQTLGVACLDLTRLGEVSFQSLGKGLPAEPAEMLGEFDKLASNGINPLRQAGVRKIFIFFNMLDLPVLPNYLVIETADKADDLAIFRLISGHKTPVTNPAEIYRHDSSPTYERRQGVLVLARQKVLDRLKANTPAQRAELVQAILAAGDAPIVAALALSADDKKVIREMAPDLLKDMGGASTDVIMYAKWAALSAAPPPAAHLKLQVQCDSDESAVAFALAWKNDLAAWTASERLKKRFPGLEKILPLLEVQAKGRQVLLDWDKSRVEQAVQASAPMLSEARNRAKLMFAMSTVNALVKGIVLYQHSHSDQYPPNLQALVDQGIIGDKMLINPRFPDRRPGYIYIRPKETEKELSKKPGAVSEHILVYESFNKWPGAVAAGFADYFVKLISNEKEFRDYLAVSLANAASQPSSRPPREAAESRCRQGPDGPATRGQDARATLILPRAKKPDP